MLFRVTFSSPPMLFPISCYFLLPSNVIPYLSILLLPSSNVIPNLSFLSPPLLPPPWSSSAGIVPSGVMTTLMQVYSRVFITWVIVDGVPGVPDNPGLLLIAYAWGITEVVRYSYYVFSLLGAVPYIIKWCRWVFVCSQSHVTRSTLSCDLECIIMWLGVHYHVTRSTLSCGSEYIIMWLGAHYHVARSTLSCSSEHIIMWLGVHYHVARSTLSCSSEHIIMWLGAHYHVTRSTLSCDSDYIIMWLNIMSWTIFPTGTPSSIFFTQLGLWYVYSESDTTSYTRFPSGVDKITLLMTSLPL